MAYTPKAKRRPLALKRKVEYVPFKLDIPVSMKAELDELRERAARAGAEVDMKDLFASVFAEALLSLRTQIEDLEKETAGEGEDEKPVSIPEIAGPASSQEIETGSLANGALNGDGATPLLHASSPEA